MSAANPFQNETAERYASGAVDAVRKAGRYVADTVSATGQRLSDGAQANGPNYRMIAPSQNAPSAPTKPPYSSVGDFVQNSMVPYWQNAGSAIGNFVDRQRKAVEPYAQTVANTVGSAFGTTASDAKNYLFGARDTGTPPAGPSGFDWTMNGRDPATGIGPKSGYVIGEPGDAAYALDQGRQANAIRQSIIDAQPRGAGIVIPGEDPRASAIERMQQAEKYQRMAANERDPYRANQYMGRARDARLASDSYSEMDKTDITADTSSGNNFRNIIAGQPLTTAQTDYYNARAAGVGRGDPPKLADIVAARDAGLFEGMDPMQLATLLDNALGGKNYEDGGVVSFADGGMVPTATGMLGNASPIQPQMAALQEYQQYASGARAMGLPAVPFNDFLGMREGAAGRATAAGSKSAVKMAEGGTVPAAGKMVVDTSPNATTDSIPAMIDGKQPAALDSGEFVFPKDVVLHFGTDKLNKMIEQARKPPDGAGQSSATGAAQRMGN